MCNFCSLQTIRANAKVSKQTVTLMASDFMSGIDVFVHPPDVDVANLEGISVPDHPNRVRYFVAWFMELPKEHVD